MVHKTVAQLPQVDYSSISCLVAEVIRMHLHTGTALVLVGGASTTRIVSSASVGF